MSKVWSKNLMIGLQIERILKMIHKDANIIIKTESGKVFYEGKRGNIFSSGLLSHNHDNDIVRLKIKNIDVSGLTVNEAKQKIEKALNIELMQIEFD